MLTFIILTQLFICNSYFLLNNNYNYNYQTKLYSRLFEREGKMFERDNLLIEKKNILNSTIDTEIIDEITIDKQDKKIRTGRSSDEDGKTNIWSIEPTIEIDDKKTNDVFKLLGIFLSVTLITFQFFLLTNPILPDPSDY